MAIVGGGSPGTIWEADYRNLLSKCQLYSGSPEAQMKTASDPGSLAAAENVSLDENASKI